MRAIRGPWEEEEISSMITRRTLSLYDTLLLVYPFGGERNEFVAMPVQALSSMTLL
ncbi:MAG: hypothetical protein ACRERS_02185 [Methylococcales bacterium]